MSFHEGSKWQEQMEDAKKFKDDIKSFTTPIPASAHKQKPFIEANVREMLIQYNNAEISFSRFVELLNEKAGYPTLSKLK